MLEIVKYQAGWNSTSNTGSIFITTVDNKKTDLGYDNPAEFNSILLILTSSNLAYIDQNWTIWSSDEPVVE